MLPRLQCTCELLKSPSAQRPVEFYADKVQFGLKEPLFSCGVCSVQAPSVLLTWAQKWEAAGQCLHGVSGSAAQHREADLQPCRGRWRCGSALLPPPCLTFNYPWCCECNADLFVQLAWDKRAILWAGKWELRGGSAVGEWCVRVMNRAVGYFCFRLKGDPELQQLRV